MRETENESESARQRGSEREKPTQTPSVTVGCSICGTNINIEDIIFPNIIVQVFLRHTQGLCVLTTIYNSY